LKNIAIFAALKLKFWYSEGTEVPSFYKHMLKDKVEKLAEQVFEENKNLFLISLDINSANHIKIVIDGDEGVSVNDCITVSRGIEHNLDREEEDFSLEVTSAGVSEPLSLPRQYRKNIGRRLKVKTENDKFEGDLLAADEKEIKLAWKAREPKPVGKGKVTVDKEATLSYDEIVEAKVKITF
jgi:ribosome maturation factor RimP